MNIGIYYHTFLEISSILYILNNHKLTQFIGYFKLSDDMDTFTFISVDDNKEDILNFQFDKSIRAIRNIGYEHQHLSGELESYDYQILSNPPEPIDFSQKSTIQFVENDNIILSSTYFDYVHKNVYYDYRFTFYFFFHHAGFNFLNFYPNDTTKKHLVGTYHSERMKNDGEGRFWLSNMHNAFKNILNDDLFSYGVSDFKLKDLLLYQGRDGKKTLNLWNGHFVSSYTDITNSVCFLSIETWMEDGEGGMDYLTEKTFKSILYSKVTSFPILYVSKKILDIMINDGFWFLNVEFYNPKSDNVHDSILATMSYLKDLKLELGSNVDVHKHLMIKYKHKLEKNSKLIDEILSDIPNRSNLINLIKKENNN